MRAVRWIFLLIILGNVLYAQNLTFVSVNSVSDWEKFTVLAKKNHMSILLTVDRGFNVSPGNYSSFYTSKCLALETKSNSELGSKMQEYFNLDRGPQALWFRADEWLMYKAPSGSWDNFEQWTAEAVDRIEHYASWGKSAENKEVLSHENWLKLLETTSFNDLVGFDHLNSLYLQTWSDSTILQPATFPYVIEFGTDIQGPLFELAQKNYDTLLALGFCWGDYISKAYERNLNKAIFLEDSSKVESIQNQLLPVQKRYNPETDSSVVYLLWADYFEGIGRYEKWESFADQYVGAKKSAKVAVEWSAKILELFGADRTSLEYSEKWLSAVQDQKDFDVDYLLAQVYYRLGKTQEAIDCAYRAETIANTGEQAQAAKNLQYYFSY